MGVRWSFVAGEIVVRKENVFLVSLRQNDAAGNPSGQIVNHVVCGRDEADVRSYLMRAIPNFAVVSAVNLLMLEAMAKKIKAALDDKTYISGI